MGLFSKLFGGTSGIHRVCPISREHIKARNHCDIENVLQLIAKDLAEQKKLVPWQLTVSGYSDDSRELVQMPEVIEWSRAANERYPYLPFLITDSKWYVLALLCNSAKLVSKGGAVQRYALDPVAFQALMLDVVTTVPQFISEYQLSEEHSKTIYADGPDNVQRMLASQ